MESTGCIRRIDDMGRVVIPKEIRRIYSLKENDPIEFFMSEDCICLMRKYNPCARYLDQIRMMENSVKEDAAIDQEQAKILLGDIQALKDHMGGC